MKKVNHYKIPKYLQAIIQDSQLDSKELLTKLNLPSDLFNRKDPQLLPNHFFLLWIEIEKQLEENIFFSKISDISSFKMFEPSLFVGLCSKNLICALNRFSLYQSLISPLQMNIFENEMESSITAKLFTNNDNELPVSFILATFLLLTEIVREGTERKINPIKITLNQMPKNMDFCQEYFQTEITKDSMNTISFSLFDANYFFSTKNHSIWHFFDECLRPQISDTNSKLSVSEKVKNFLLTMLPSGDTSIEETAFRLNVSKRTLQRHLTQESTSYQDLLNKIRHQLAEHYLKTGRVSLSEISFLLGFQDSNSFLRAFKFWSGDSPGEFRSNLIKSQN